MKTQNIMNIHQYDSVGGTIDAVPTSDVKQFCQRVLDRLFDIQNGMSIEKFETEIKETIKKI